MSPKISTKNQVDSVLAQNNPKSPGEKTLISWKTKEFISYRRSFWWFFAAITILVLAEIYLLFTRQWFAGVTFFVLGIALYRYTRIEPKDVECKITGSGIHFGQGFYSFYNLRSYWVTGDHTISILNLGPNKRFSLPISIPLENIEPEKVTQILGTYVPEQRQKVEELIYKITRLLKL